LSLFAGAVFTTAIGAVVAVPSLRLKNIYLAIATLGFGVVLQKIIFEWRSLTGGGGGMALTAPRIAGYELSATGLYYLTLVVMTLGLFGAWNVSRGRTGRALLVIKDSEIAAGSLGIHAARYKVIAFAISAFYAAIAGGLFAYLVRYINPESFSVGLSISFLSMVVIGGLGTIGGSIVGAAFYVIVPELLRGIKDAPGLVFGLLLVLVMVFMPQGLWGMLRRLGRRSPR
jgi:branched-chain amino acid transport system permease protein